VALEALTSVDTNPVPNTPRPATSPIASDLNGMLGVRGNKSCELYTHYALHRLSYSPIHRDNRINDATGKWVTRNRAGRAFSEGEDSGSNFQISLLEKLVHHLIMSGCLDIDMILCEEDRVPCKFLIHGRRMGVLDSTTVDEDVPEDTRLDGTRSATPDPYLWTL